MKIVNSLFLVFLFVSCEQTSERQTSTHKDSARVVKSNDYTNSVTITNNEYLLDLKGVKDTFQTLAQLRNTLEKGGVQLVKDTMYVYMKSTNVERMTKFSPILRSLGINKYQFIITDDFFALPYPKEAEKAAQK